MRKLLSTSRTSGGTGLAARRVLSLNFTLIRIHSLRIRYLQKHITCLMRMEVFHTKPLGNEYFSYHSRVQYFSVRLDREKNHYAYIDLCSCFSVPKLIGIMGSAWHKRCLKRSIGRDQIWLNLSQKLRTVRASSTSSVHVKPMTSMRKWI